MPAQTYPVDEAFNEAINPAVLMLVGATVIVKPSVRERLVPTYAEFFEAVPAPSQ